MPNYLLITESNTLHGMSAIHQPPSQQDTLFGTFWQLISTILWLCSICAKFIFLFNTIKIFGRISSWQIDKSLTQHMGRWMFFAERNLLPPSLLHSQGDNDRNQFSLSTFTAIFETGLSQSCHLKKTIIAHVMLCYKSLKGFSRWYNH